MKYNCNQQVQRFLNAGGKEFASSEFDWLNTMPNNVYKNVIKEIRDGKRDGWYYGYLSELKEAYDECAE